MKKLSLKVKIILSLAVLGGFFSIIAATWYQTSISRPASAHTKSISLEIVEGSSGRQIARQLKKQGLINSPTAFIAYVRLNKIILNSGFYVLDANQTIPVIAEKIGSGKVSEYKVTIIEGWRSEQIAQALDQRGIVNYEQFMSAAQGRQGRLFPDTYRFAVQTTAEDIVAKMEQNFERRIKEAGIEKVSESDIITASIVEREAKHDQDRPKMAGVFENRLRIGMALEADPTVQYAVDELAVSKLEVSERKNYQFWGKITGSSTKTVQSPYNTYLNRGLPPAPIANPGIKSIRAATEPEKHNYFFFFNLSDGTTIYSKTRAEHNANLAKHNFGR